MKRARADLMAGLTTAVVLVPQALAYAMLAGLPPVVGLYASVLPLLAYAALGSSRHLAVGPVAIDSLIIGASLGGYVAAGSPEYLSAAILVAFLVGVLQVIYGTLRLGFISRLLTPPIVRGFVSGSAVLIAASQLGHILGAELPRGLLEIIAVLPPSPHWPTVGITAFTVVTLIVLKRFAESAPRALIVVVSTTVASYYFSFRELDINVVGEVASGFPTLAIPPLDSELVQAVLPIVLLLSVLSFAEAMTVSETFAERFGYKVSPNREFVALGAANLLSGISGGYSVTGALSRTAVNTNAGGRTRWSTVVTAIIVGLVLMFLTDTLTHMPLATLGSIILVASLSLIDVDYAKSRWSHKDYDLFTYVVTLFTTILAGPVIGLTAGIVVHLPPLVRELRAVMELRRAERASATDAASE